LTLKEERRLRVFVNGVLRRIFGPKSDEIIGGWRKLYNEELHNFHASPNIINNCQVKEYEMGRACSTHRRDKECIQDFVGKPQRKRPLEKPRHEWEDIIKMDLEWTDLAQDRDQWRALVNTVMNL
jgi:hypothetical protein